MLNHPFFTIYRAICKNMIGQKLNHQAETAVHIAPGKQDWLKAKQDSVFYQCIISCGMLFSQAAILRAASEDNPRRRHPLQELRAAMRSSPMQASANGQRTRTFDREMQEKVRDPRYRFGNRRHYLGDQQKEILDIMLDCAQATHPLGFTDAMALMFFYGPPGTGKSYFAEACVGEINATLPQNQQKYKFLSVMAAALNQGYASDGTQRAQALVRCLERNRPIIALIDETDDLANRSGAGNDFVSRNLEHTTTELWIQLDSVKEARDICVIGATNRKSNLDVALQSRLEWLIPFDYFSDAKKINEFIQYHTNCPGYRFSEDIVWPHNSFYYRYIQNAYLSHREIKFLANCAKI